MATKATAKPKFGDIQDKTKEIYENCAAAFADAKTFTQGNLDAVVESGSILGAGLKQLGETYVAEGRSAAATFNADIAELADLGSPVELFKLQSKIVSRNFGTAIDFHSKNAEAVLKLAEASAAPLAKRVGAAVEGVRKAI